MNKKEIELAVSRICSFLDNNLSNGRFPGRTFYGEMFCVLALANFNEKKYESSIQQIMTGYCFNTAKDSPEFHWEFNNYAFLCLKELVDVSKYEKYFFPMRFKGTKSTNWILLRYYSMYKINRIRLQDKIQLLFRSALLIRKSGFIKDSLYDNSFQYHFFSTYLFLELYLISGNKKYKKRFMKAITFTKKFVLQDGTAEYIGRGQFQIFGIGPLLVSLEYAYSFSGEKEFKKVQVAVWDNLLKCQRADGGFPLVLPKDEVIKSDNIREGEKCILGWYGYNNYYDYVSFLAYFLTRLNEIYVECEFDKDYYSLEEIYTEDFTLVRRKCYESVVSNPTGSWANALPVPYIITSEGKRITNTYGGEQYGSILYCEKGVPLPWGEIEDCQKVSNADSIRVVLSILLKRNRVELLKLYRKNRLSDKREFYFLNKLSYSLHRRILYGVSESIDHKREYKFEEKVIRLKDTIYFNQDIKFVFFYPIYILVDKGQAGKQVLEQNENRLSVDTEHYALLINSDNEFDLDDTVETQYNAQRELCALAGKSRRVKFQKGEKISVEYKFLLKISE